MGRPDLAITTGSFYPTATRDAVVRIAQLCFKQVEITVQEADVGYDFYRQVGSDFFHKLRDLVSQLGLSVGSLHAPYLSGVQAFSSKARTDIFLMSLEATALLQGDELIVHPYHIFRSYEGACSYFSDSSATAADFLLPEFLSIIRNAKEYGVRVTVENIAHWQDEPLLNEPRNMLRLVSDLDETVSMDLDLYHSEVGGKTAEFVAKLRRHILSIHLSDCNDSGMRTLPGRGRLDWERLASEIQKLPNLEHLVLEVPGGFQKQEILESRDYLREALGLVT